MDFPFENWNLFTLNVGFSSHDGDWNWQHVRSPFARLYFVTEGSAQVEFHGERTQRLDLCPGNIYLIPPYSDHSDVCSGRFSHYYIHVYEEPTGESLFDNLHLPYAVKAEPVDGDLFASLTQLNPFLSLSEKDPKSYDNHQTLINNLSLNRRRELFNKIESRGILYILFSRFLRNASLKDSLKDERIRQVLQYIKVHLSEQMDLDALSRISCMSKDHFIRKFRKEVGETPNVYITRRKMERAELLLLTTNMPVKEIAYSLGYSESAYFCRVFTKLVGLSPTSYREQHF